MSRISAAWLLSISLGLTAWGGLTNDADTDLERVQGDWRTKMETPDGVVDATMTVEGRKLRFDGPVPLGSIAGSFELDEKSRPKRMTIEIEDADVKEWKGLSVQAIYTLEEKSWTICATAPGSPDGPKGFDDDKARTIDLKRLK